MRKKWNFASIDKERVAELAEICKIPAFTALLLSSGGIDTPDAVFDFLDREALPGDPFNLKDMQPCVARILSAIDEGSRICVYGDYDADGVCATALLYSYLETVGADVIYYIPSRLEEGYGLHVQAVEELARSEVALIITVDTGVTAFDAAQRAAELGIELVITDHHKPGECLPAVIGVIDPCREDDISGLSYLAGVGVAFKLVCGLENGCTHELLDEYAQLVALGTVADVMPLCGENRAMVIAGLDGINREPLTGIAALLSESGLSDKRLDAGHVAFGLAPRINAAGRMGNAITALQLLLSETQESAAYYACELEEKNEQRHAAEAAILQEIDRSFHTNASLCRDRILVVSGKGWHEGVIGIAASKLAEVYGRPAVVIAEGENGIAKGSCRGVSDFSIYQAVASCEELLLKFGGHTQAAGFSMQCEKIDAFREKINRYARVNIPSAATIDICCKLNPVGISDSLLHALELLEPFGAGNPKPVFAVCGLELQTIVAIGNGKHSRLRLKRGDTVFQAVWFGFSPETIPFRNGDHVDIAAVVEKNAYNGRVLPSVQIKAMRFSGTDDEQLFASYQIFRKIESGGTLSAAEKTAALPDRRLISVVYRYIKSHGGAACTEEIILKRTGCADRDLCRIAVAVKALADCGLICAESGGWKIVENAKKADLTGVPVLAMLGYTDR